MILKSKIDFSNTYPVQQFSDDLRISRFDAVLKSGDTVPFHIVISDEEHELLNKVFNMSFGPVSAKGKIDDNVRWPQKDFSKTFSTILFAAFTYLLKIPGHSIGIDGSTNSRAFLYYWILQRNFDYLSKYFSVFGLKYYVRISRFGKTPYDNPFDFDDIRTEPQRIWKGIKIPPEEMYNYFVLKLKT